MEDEFNNEKKEKTDPNEENITLNIKDTIRDMKNEFSEQMRELKNDVEEIKEGVGSSERSRKPKPPKRPKRPKGEFTFNFGKENFGDHFGASIENYIGGLLDSVGDAIDKSVGSIFQSSSSRRPHHKSRRRKEQTFVSEEELDEFYDQGSAIMGALSDANRLRMLKELEKQPLRQSDLSEKTNTKGGNFKHHISILKENGLVRQEGVRERYLLTFAGREALKLVEFLYARGKKRLQVPVIIDDSEEEE